MAQKVFDGQLYWCVSMDFKCACLVNHSMVGRQSVPCYTWPGGSGKQQTGNQCPEAVVQSVGTQDWQPESGDTRLAASVWG